MLKQGLAPWNAWRGENAYIPDLAGADLRVTQLVCTDLRDADVTGCRIYGISAWDVKLERAKQQSLVISFGDEPEITVDNIEVAQFIYLMLRNQKIRDVIDAITSKAVSCGPDAPTLASSLAEVQPPNRVGMRRISVRRRWQKSPVTGESAKETVKTIACGNAG
jgi:hypothetical protein